MHTVTTPDGTTIAYDRTGAGDPLVLIGGACRRGEAVRYFMVDGMGAPSFVPSLLRLMPGVWKRLTAVAPTLPYDAQLIERYQAGRPLPAGQWAAVTMPALVMCGTEKESPAFLRHAAAAVADALPNGQLIERRGLGHAKKLTPGVIAATLTGFLAGQERDGASPGTRDPGTTPAA